MISSTITSMGEILTVVFWFGEKIIWHFIFIDVPPPKDLPRLKHLVSSTENWYHYFESRFSVLVSAFKSLPITRWTFFWKKIYSSRIIPIQLLRPVPMRFFYIKLTVSKHSPFLIMCYGANHFPKHILAEFNP